LFWTRSQAGGAGVPGYRGFEYRSVRGARTAMVHEQGAGFAYGERHLQCTWYDPAYRPDNLQTVDGEALTIEDPGRWNLSAGPDFLDAVLSVAPQRRRLRGDVEVHARPGDWRLHGHARDARYSNVVAHVTYFPGRLPPALLPPGAVQVALKPFLAGNPLFSFECIDVTAYPYAARQATPAPCARIFKALSPESSTDILEQAGRERHEIKARRTADGIDEKGVDQQFYEDLMYALGYKQNRVPFRRLARLVPLDRLRQEAGPDPIRGYALLLGVAGLMPKRPAANWDNETRSFVRTLWDVWWKEQSRWTERALQPSSWCRSGIRPQNHPVRRLAAAASLFCRDASPAGRLSALDTADARQWYARAAEILCFSGAIPYWSRRLSLGGAPAKNDVALLGSRRIAAIVYNVFLPTVRAVGRKTDHLLPLMPAEEDNSLIRRTAHTLFGPDHNPAFYRTGLRQQGLLQIFYDFCLNDRDGCRKCRLAAALGKTMPGQLAVDERPPDAVGIDP